MYEIEKGVPLQEERGFTKRYPLQQMEVGDSFSVPYLEAQQMRSAVKNLALCANGRFREWKFVTRKQGDMVRCWRIE